MPWTIDYYSEAVRLEIEALPVGIRAAYARLTELLEEFGLDKKTPGTPTREFALARRRQREVRTL
jgi:hypothetical protein